MLARGRFIGHQQHRHTFAERSFNFDLNKLKPERSNQRSSRSIKSAHKPEKNVWETELKDDGFGSTQAVG